MTLNQAAGLMTISRRTLERLISAGEFPAPLKIGRASRVDREDIANYLERLREERGDRIGSS